MEKLRDDDDSVDM